MKNILFTEEDLYDDQYDGIVALTPSALLNCALRGISDVDIPDHYFYPTRLNIVKAVEDNVIETLIKKLKTGPVFLLGFLESCDTTEYWMKFMDDFIQENELKDKFKIHYSGNNYRLLIMLLLDMQKNNIIELVKIK